MSIPSMTESLRPDVSAAVQKAVEDWQSGGKVKRLWDGDASLWSSDDEGKWLGWLHVIDESSRRETLAKLNAIAQDVKTLGAKDVLLMGMGGSSLCPEVLKMTFGHVAGWPALHVLDSTVPAQVASVRDGVDLKETVGIVASKSGGTTEPNVFRQYFQAQIAAAIAPEPAGARMIAITDPGTKMQKVAEENGFRHIAFGIPTIGGRFSALSNFGLVPAAVMGLDVEDFLRRAGLMVKACGPDSPAATNPGVRLGLILGTLAQKFHRDKVTLVTSPPIGDLGAWLEQLIAESTGKLGKGLIPIDGEDLGPPSTYGDDRVFVYVRLEAAPSAEQDAGITALEAAGHPVIRVPVADPMDLGGEFFRWEIATAVAGSVLGINAFNQPDVEASKIKTRELSEEFSRTGKVRDELPVSEGNGVKLFTNEANAEALSRAALTPEPVDYLRAHLSRFEIGDYFAMTAYVAMNAENHALLAQIRHLVRERRTVATTLGFGPRFLHSTGQLHKGGPNTGVFLQITSDDAFDLAIPGETFTFGQLKGFQAQGDFAVLAERHRRALRVHLGADVAAGLRGLLAMVEAALG
jgi:transaldolase / glucose-6-phosphate isomerase